MRKELTALLSVLCAPAMSGGADSQEENNRQCRSVHLAYQAGEARALYNEVVVEKSSPGTYFCALGFERGYFGMQELRDGRKVVIFSVWDDSPGQNKQSAVPRENRAMPIEKGAGVVTRRFGNEGTGGQSFFSYDWKPGETVRFLVRALATEDGGQRFTDFQAWFHDNRNKRWQMMARFRAPTKGILLRHPYSFVEDFRRDYKSAGIVHRARFQNTWALETGGIWKPLAKARFTADRTPSKAIDAGKEKNGFFLQTGGNTRMETTKLWHWMEAGKKTGRVTEDVRKLLKQG